ncbi:Mite allergen Der f 7 like protein [Argiope bruennichi]|uniref:Mite allergen Der f 7 like protein n=1 Tax=Argiope bruennichi TaxID=94029 RepID=A0A8T0FIW2_ARGBR|nr:Mite allergen Der f 7 like protein [Argiope bruennichi]
MRALLAVSFIILVLKTSARDISSESVHQRVEPDPDLENYLREAIENFREQMKEGIPAINMPVLDPLELKNLDINVAENLATMDLSIKTLTVRCLSIFNIMHLSPNLEEMYLAINLTLPEIYVHGQYRVDGKLVKIFPIYGQGYFDLNATDINISGVGKLGFTTDTVQMELLKLDLYWEHLAVFMENFLGGGSFSEVLQRIVPNVGRDIFNVYKPLMLEKMETCLTDRINNKLNQPFVKDIIKDITNNTYVLKTTEDKIWKLIGLSSWNLSRDFSKMKTIIYATLLLCICGTTFCKDEELQKRVNDYIDDFIQKATNGSGGFIDPLPLDELKKGFEREIGFVRVKGEAKLYNGKIYGLSTMKRKGNATVLNLDDMLIISTELIFKKLNATYKGALLLNDAGPTISLNAKVGRSQVSMIIIAPAEGGKAEMMSFSINKLQDIRVSIWGLGPMGWAASIMSTLALNALEKPVAKASSIKVMEHFMKEIEKVPFPGKAAE